MSTVNLFKDKTKILIAPISNVYIRDMAWAGTTPSVNIGFGEKGTLKLTAAKRVFEQLDESEIQLGYDFSFEIVSPQFYSMYEVEKFAGKLCLLTIHEGQFYIKDVQVTVELDYADGKTSIKIAGKKFIQKLRDAIDGNPWGSLPGVWALPSSSPEGSLPFDKPASEGVTLEDVYGYILRKDDPLIEFITPASPEPTDDLEQFKLTMVDEYHNPLKEAPESVIVKRVVIDGMQTIPDTDYEVMRDDDLLIKVYYNKAESDIKLNEKIIVFYGDDAIPIEE